MTISNNLYNQKPYSLEVIDGWFGLVKCNIFFEDTCIREISGPIRFVKSVVELLNFAYNNGFGSGHVKGELKQLNESNKLLKEALDKIKELQNAETV